MDRGSTKCSPRIMDDGSPIRRCDDLFEAGRLQEAYDAISAVRNDPDPEIQWRVARMMFKLAESKGDETETIQAIDHGLKLLRELLKTTPTCANAHKWLAILLGSKAKHDSFKQKLEESFVIRDHLLKARELNPNDGYIHFILGKWCYTIASMTSVQKKLATTLFPHPPQATYQEALNHFKVAESLVPPTFTECYLMMAMCYIELQDKPHSKEYLAKCVAQEHDEVSRNSAALARELAKRFNIAI